MELLKMLHFLAFAVGIGGGMAAGIVAAQAGPANPALAARIQGLIGRATFAALVVLWITGPWMALATDLATDLWFWLKILAVLVLTAAAVRMQLAARAPGPEAAVLGRKLGPVMMLSSVLAVIFAVLAFN